MVYLHSMYSINRNKSKNGIVTRNTPQHVMNKFSNEVVKEYYSPYLGMYLSNLVIGNRYLSGISKENVFSDTIAGNITVVKYVISLVTIPFLPPAYGVWGKGMFSVCLLTGGGWNACPCSFRFCNQMSAGLKWGYLSGVRSGSHVQWGDIGGP